MILTDTYIRLCRLLERLGIPLHGSLHYIGGSDTLPAPLTREEEARLLAQLEEDGEDRRSARSRLIEHNLRLVAHIINKGGSKRKQFVAYHRSELFPEQFTECNHILERKHLNYMDSCMASIAHSGRFNSQSSRS